MAIIKRLERLAAAVNAAQNKKEVEAQRFTGYESTKAFKARIRKQKAEEDRRKRRKKNGLLPKEEFKEAVQDSLNSLAGGEYKDSSCTIGSILEAAGVDLIEEMEKAAKAARAKEMREAKAKRKEALAKAKAAAKALAAAKAAAASAKADSKKGWVSVDKRARAIAIDILKGDLAALKALEKALKWAIAMEYKSIDALYILAADARKAGDRGLAVAIIGERVEIEAEIAAKRAALAKTREEIKRLNAILENIA